MKAIVTRGGQERAVVTYEGTILQDITGPDKGIIAEAFTKEYDTITGRLDGHVRITQAIKVKAGDPLYIDTVLFDIIQHYLNYVVELKNE